MNGLQLLSQSTSHRSLANCSPKCDDFEMVIYNFKYVEQQNAIINKF